MFAPVAKKELRKFGLVCGGLFALLFGIAPALIFQEQPYRWPFVVALVLTIPATIAPILLTPFYSLWLKLGALLHAINSPLILGVIYFTIFTPIGFFLRLRKKQPIQSNWDKDAESYRVVRSRDPVANIERPY